MHRKDELVIDNIKRRLGELGQEKQWLAERMGIRKESLSRLLSKRSPPARATVERAAEALGCSLSDLYGEPSPSPTIEDSIELLQSFRDADPNAQAFALAFLKGNVTHLVTQYEAPVLAKLRELIEAVKSASKSRP